jgi:hypothetical protein
VLRPAWCSLVLAVVVLAGGGRTAGAQAQHFAIPCGYVDFKPTRAPRYVGTTAYETIRATLHFPDGHTESDVFPYPWAYPNGEQTDPWSMTNLLRGDFVVGLQLPPLGFDRTSLSPLLAFVVAHTAADGTTDLKDCPRPSPTPLPADRLAVMERPMVGDWPSSAPFEARAYFVGHPVAGDIRHPAASLEICAVFTNLARRPVRRMQFAFLYADAQWLLIGVDPLDVRADVPPGMRIGWPAPENGGTVVPRCRVVSLAPADRARFEHLRMSVREVEYDDGSRWSNPNPLPTLPTPR